jgi:nitrite reductase/ring-hydroxylating ferredoxin subunit
LAAVAAALASACGTGTLGGSPTGPGSVNLTVNLADYAALATVGGIARLNGTSTPVAVVRTATSSYRAFSLICPHAGTVIGINGSGFLCPNHRASFSSTGQWTGGERTSNLWEFTVTANTSAGTLTVSS